MGFDQAVETIRETLTIMLVLSAPVLAAGLIIGLAISIFQAVTQIQDQTLSFVPKIIVMGIVAILVTPWIAGAVVEFAERMFSGAP